MVRQRSIFDIVGPIMIGPSSSHTAGAVRLGLLARAIFGGQPSRACIGLHGSFASTGPGHGTDLALIAGLLGMQPDDERIPAARKVAQDSGLEIEFAEKDLGQAHPNTARFELEDAHGQRMVLQGSSLGGGSVTMTDIDGFEVEVSGDLPMLVVEHPDRPGEIAAVTSLIAAGSVNIASMQVSRERKGARALMLIETDVPVTDEIVKSIAEKTGASEVRRIPSV